MFSHPWPWLWLMKKECAVLKLCSLSHGRSSPTILQEGVTAAGIPSSHHSCHEGYLDHQGKIAKPMSLLQRPIHAPPSWNERSIRNLQKQPVPPPHLSPLQSFSLHNLSEMQLLPVAFPFSPFSQSLVLQSRSPQRALSIWYHLVVLRQTKFVPLNHWEIYLRAAADLHKHACGLCTIWTLDSE